MYTELEQRYYQAERLHMEKFGDMPYFMGIINPSADGEEYIELINNAIRNNRAVNQLKYAPSKVSNNTVIF